MRITESAVALHEELGPARTSISAVAERAGVRRSTVYRHFPDEEALFAACSSHWRAANPPPDPGAWAAIEDPARAHRDRAARALRVLRRAPRRCTRACCATSRSSRSSSACSRDFYGYLRRDRGRPDGRPRPARARGAPDARGDRPRARVPDVALRSCSTRASLPTRPWR